MLLLYSIIIQKSKCEVALDFIDHHLHIFKAIFVNYLSIMTVWMFSMLPSPPPDYVKNAWLLCEWCHNFLQCVLIIKVMFPLFEKLSFNNIGRSNPPVLFLSGRWNSQIGILKTSTFSEALWIGFPDSFNCSNLLLADLPVMLIYSLRTNISLTPWFLAFKTFLQIRLISHGFQAPFEDPKHSTKSHVVFGVGPLEPMPPTMWPC